MYEKAIVSFVDILGFKELVENSTSEIVKSALDLVNRFAAPKVENEDLDFSFVAESISFSDCIVRMRRIEKEPNLSYPAGLVFYEIIDLLHAQGELLNQGILIRGGIAYGDIYFDKNQIFGTALNQAYELEAKYAVYPRIVLSPDLIKETKINKLLKSDSHTYEMELEYIAKLIKLGDEGLWFIDYLRAMESELDDPGMYHGYLLGHKNIICEGAKKFQKMNNTLSKYLWMAKYHNDCVNKISDEWYEAYETTKTSFEISSNELELLQNLSI